MVHLVHCDSKEKVLKKILEGTKTMIVRGATVRDVPHSRVFDGDVLYLMERGSKKIYVKASVAYVENYSQLSEDKISSILNDNQDKLNLSAKQKKKWHKKCLCLVAIEDVEEIEPLEFDRDCNVADWLIIERIEDVVIGTSKPYNYENYVF
jgi:hypothetical protein